ncbi:hypothetical protein MSG28_014685 [Choristoneura fumiferana]|uniref:Uncharacterized protein n=1 Tax=Choristoneura fumiferana TaxID=7141 RepID=A0ACC0JSM5_CHOFU|nr:hypothetical protein MSG28_014685 [Choristoneura fumiferana]
MRFELKKALFNWKKTRLEALELFARAQFVISEMTQPAPVQLASTNRTYKRKRRPKKNNRAICLNEQPKSNPVSQNMVEKDGNKENQGPPSTQTLTSQVGTDTDKNIKIDDSEETKVIKCEDTKDNITQFFDTLKYLKKENTDHESVLNNNIDSNFIPQLLVANVKLEGVDCNIVKNEANESRKRKNSRSERRRSKRVKME